MLRSEDKSAVRRATSLDPGFPREDPPTRPVRPVPTDVPLPETRDVPVRDPQDVPPPDPGAKPKSIKPRPTRPDTKPRTTP